MITMIRLQHPLRSAASSSSSNTCIIRTLLHHPYESRTLPSRPRRTYSNSSSTTTRYKPQNRSKSTSSKSNHHHHHRTSSSFLHLRQQFSSQINKRKQAIHEIRDTFRSKLTENRCLTILPAPLRSFDTLRRWATVEYSITELAGHLSFVLVAASYAVDDFLLLRVIAVAGSTSMLVFTYFHPHGRVLWLPFRWNLLFIGINSYRIGRVLYEKYAVRNLTRKELELHHHHFQVMDLTDFAKLLKLGTLETFEKGDVVLKQGDMNADIRLVTSGELDVLRDGVYTYSLGEGNFMSEAGLHIGMRLMGHVQASGTVVCNSGKKCECIRWDRTKLIELLESEKDLKRSFLSALSWDIIEKLKGQRHMLMDGKINKASTWTEKRNTQSEFRYVGILKNILSRPGKHLSEKSRDEIDNYRTIHHIDDKHHAEALEICGWTEEEFTLGFKQDSVAELEEGTEDDDFAVDFVEISALDIY